MTVEDRHRDDADVQARIFEKFYRGQEARTLEAQGLGLGLALVRQLVHAHGGTITVQSAPGQGQHLPRRPAAATKTTQEVHDGPGAETARRHDD